MGLLSGLEGLKLLKMIKYTTFGHFKYISTSKNLVLNTFSGSSILWRLLGEYELLGVLLCWYMGYLSGSEGLQNDQNYQIHDFWTL